jgi:hypothetical protein
MATGPVWQAPGLHFGAQGDLDLEAARLDLDR